MTLIKRILVTFNIILLLLVLLLLYLNFHQTNTFNESNRDSNGVVDVTASPFNAKGDGNTDDTTAIQKAVDSLKNGGVVFLPEGTYNISYPIKIKDGITLTGAGTVATKLKNIGKGYAIEAKGEKVTKPDGSVDYKIRRYQTIRDLTVEGNKNSAGGINLTYTGEYFELDKLRIIGNINGIGINLQDSYSGIIKNVHVSQSTNNTGIKLHGSNVSTGQISFINVVVAYSKYGIEIGESYNTEDAQIIDSVSLTGCILQHNSKAGLRIGSNARQMKIMSTHFEWQDSPGAVGLEIDGNNALGGSIDSSWFYKNNTAISIDNAEGYIFENINIQESYNGIVQTKNAKSNKIGEYVRFVNVKNNIINR